MLFSMSSWKPALFLCALSFFLAYGDDLRAGEIKLVGGSAVAPVMAELVPQFEKLSGHKVRADLDGAIGQMTERIMNGETADVVIVSGAQIEALSQQGKIVQGTRIDLAKVGIGAFVKKGASKPDISTVEAFKHALLSARSIGYNDPAAGAPVSLYLIDLFQRLGLTEAVSPKTVVFKKRSERFDAVARGDVELGFNQVSEILAVPAVDFVGPLPEAIQRYTLFSAAIAEASAQRSGAAEFIRFISAPDVRGIWKANGFESP